MFPVPYTMSLLGEMKKRDSFRDDHDRNNFLQGLGTIIEDRDTRYYNWALLPNRCHLLFKTDLSPIATAMRRLLNGYAVSFNRRHRCNGHLFQNRYKSILSQEKVYINHPSVCRLIAMRESLKQKGIHY